MQRASTLRVGHAVPGRNVSDAMTCPEEFSSVILQLVNAIEGIREETSVSRYPANDAQRRAMEDHLRGSKITNRVDGLRRYVPRRSTFSFDLTSQRIQPGN